MRGESKIVGGGGADGHRPKTAERHTKGSGGARTKRAVGKNNEDDKPLTTVVNTLNMSLTIDLTSSAFLFSPAAFAAWRWATAFMMLSSRADSTLCWSLSSDMRSSTSDTAHSDSTHPFAFDRIAEISASVMIRLREVAVVVARFCFLCVHVIFGRVRWGRLDFVPITYNGSDDMGEEDCLIYSM